jgi:hypothetical protein
MTFPDKIAHQRRKDHWETCLIDREPKPRVTRFDAYIPQRCTVEADLGARLVFLFPNVRELHFNGLEYVAPSVRHYRWDRDDRFQPNVSEEEADTHCVMVQTLLDRLPNLVIFEMRGRVVDRNVYTTKRVAERCIRLPTSLLEYTDTTIGGRTVAFSTGVSQLRSIHLGYAVYLPATNPPDWLHELPHLAYLGYYAHSQTEVGHDATWYQSVANHPSLRQCVPARLFTSSSHTSTSLIAKPEVSHTPTMQLQVKPGVSDTPATPVPTKSADRCLC